MVSYAVMDVVRNANALALYVVLKRYAGANGDAHPTRRKLAEDIGFSSVTPVDKALEFLRGVGLVETFPRFRDKDGATSRVQDDRYREQTSNGYRIFGVPSARVDAPPTSVSDTPPTSVSVGPLHSVVEAPYIPGLHKGDTSKGDTLEGDTSSPLTPQGEAGSQATGGEQSDGEQSVGQLALVPEVVDAEVVEDPPAKKRARNDYPPEFNEWWALYPWPDDKKNTYKQWKPAVRKVGSAFLMERLEVWLPSLRAQFEKDPQYVVRPWNWLKNDRYTANPPTPPRQNVSKAERIFHTGVDLVDQHQQYDQQQAVQQHYVPKELAW